MFCCYLLNDLTRNNTYIGFTVNPTRRLRQHNRHVKGGAKTTGKGVWEMVLVVYGFPTKTDALSFEWNWQHPGQSKLLRNLIPGLAIGTPVARGGNGPRMGPRAQIAIMMTMLHVDKWKKFPLQCSVLSDKWESTLRIFPAPPPHILFEISTLAKLADTVKVTHSNSLNTNPSQQGEGHSESEWSAYAGDEEDVCGDTMSDFEADSVSGCHPTLSLSGKILPTASEFGGLPDTEMWDVSGRLEHATISDSALVDCEESPPTSDRAPVVPPPGPAPAHNNQPHTASHHPPGHFGSQRFSQPIMFFPSDEETPNHHSQVVSMELDESVICIDSSYSSLPPPDTSVIELI